MGIRPDAVGKGGGGGASATHNVEKVFGRTRLPLLDTSSFLVVDMDLLRTAEVNSGKKIRREALHYTLTTFPSKIQCFTQLVVLQCFDD